MTVRTSHQPQIRVILFTGTDGQFVLTSSCPITTMSTTRSTSDDPDLEMTRSEQIILPHLRHNVTHVFLPAQLPDTNRLETLQEEHSIARALCAAAHAYYSVHVYGTSEQAQWHRITKMLDNLQASTLDDGNIISQLREMRTGGTLTPTV